MQKMVKLLPGSRRGKENLCGVSYNTERKKINKKTKNEELVQARITPFWPSDPYTLASEPAPQTDPQLQMQVSA
jgi:hypothetical protein